MGIRLREELKVLVQLGPMHVSQVLRAYDWQTCTRAYTLNFNVDALAAGGGKRILRGA